MLKSCGGIACNSTEVVLTDVRWKSSSHIACNSTFQSGTIFAGQPLSNEGVLLYCQGKIRKENWFMV